MSNARALLEVGACALLIARLDRSEAVEPEKHVTFETWGVYFRTVTANRVAILCHVAALKGAGLLGITKAGITTDCDADHATIDDHLVARAVGTP